MKFYKNIIMIVLLLLVSLACDNTDLDLLDDPNAVTSEKANTELFFNTVQGSFVQFFANASNISNRIVRIGAAMGGNKYDNNVSPNTFNGMWNAAYSSQFPDVQEMLLKTEEVGLTTHSGAAKLLKAYIMMTLVDFFGDVPYSDALQGPSVPSPVADNQVDVYNDALALINEAIADFQTTPKGSPETDLFYNGDATGWLRVANTMKLRWYLNTRLVNAATSTTEINALIAGGMLINSSVDDFQFEYGTNRTNPDSRHSYYSGAYETGGPYMSNYMMWEFRGGETGNRHNVRDPRIRYYYYRQDLDAGDEDQFTLACVNAPRPLHFNNDWPWCVATNLAGGTDQAGAPTLNDASAAEGYWGRDHGNNDGIPPDGQKRTTWGIYPGGGKFDNGEGTDVQSSGTDGAGGAGIEPIMLSSFVKFMLAEAALELGTTGTARTYFEEGIRESIDKVMSYSTSIGDVQIGGTDDNGDPVLNTQPDIDAYVAEALVRYDAAADKLDEVMHEYWRALIGNGVEMYNAYRRTGGRPLGMQATRQADPGSFTRLMWYPADYVNLNANKEQRTTVSEQVFWDTNPAGILDF